MIVELAALTGMGDPTERSVYPGRNTPSSTMRSGASRSHAVPKPYDPNEDDPVEHTGAIKGGTAEQPHYIVAPSIQVLSEFTSLTRTPETSQPLTCIVVIELPGKRPNTPIPGQLMQVQREAVATSYALGVQYLGRELTISKVRS